jgi:hypothetical protein
MLPDVALLEVFDFYVNETWRGWYKLVHMCQKWRDLAFGSSRRLKMQLYCTSRTVRKTLDIWPPLPIAIAVYPGGIDNVIPVLEHNNRIWQLDLFHWHVSSSQLEKVLAAMQQPFPALTRLWLQSREEMGLVIPASFLGGSAPLLQELLLDCIPFPGLPKILLSATHLVTLRLRRIPDSGYISPDAMLTCFSVLTKLKSLEIKFNSPQSCPDWKSRHPPPQTRVLLSFLTSLVFNGVSEYLEDLMAWIDAPQLDKLEITFFHQQIFDTPQLAQFIGRTPKLKPETRDRVHVVFFNMRVSVTLSPIIDGTLELMVSCDELDLQISSLVQICRSSFPRAFIPAVEHLHIIKYGIGDWQGNIETLNNQWLEFLRPFVAVKDLYLDYHIRSHIAPALQELVGGRVTEVLPALQTLFLEWPLPSGSVQEAIVRFVAARQLAHHPIATSRWEKEGGRLGQVR